jgi:hypothetical protein
MQGEEAAAEESQARIEICASFAVQLSDMELQAVKYMPKRAFDFLTVYKGSEASKRGGGGHLLEDTKGHVMYKRMSAEAWSKWCRQLQAGPAQGQQGLSTGARMVACLACTSTTLLTQQHPAPLLFVRPLSKLLPCLPELCAQRRLQR